MYLTPDDFRAASVHVAAWQRTLETTDDVTDQLLLDAIDLYSAKLDDWTNDHYEAVADTVTVDGSSIDTLILPKRFTEVTTVVTIALDGTETTEDGDNWRHISSLDSTGARAIRTYDRLDVIGSGLSGTINPWKWDCAGGSIRITGTSGWTVTPVEIQQALALLVWNHFQPEDLSLAQLERIRTADTDKTFASSTPSGFPFVDEIIARFTYEAGLRVA